MGNDATQEFREVLNKEYLDKLIISLAEDLNSAFSDKDHEMVDTVWGRFPIITPQNKNFEIFKSIGYVFKVWLEENKNDNPATYFDRPSAFYLNPHAKAMYERLDEEGFFISLTLEEYAMTS